MDDEQRRVPPERLAAWQDALEVLGKAQRRLARVQAELIDDYDVTAHEQILPDGQIVPRPPEAPSP